MVQCDLRFQIGWYCGQMMSVEVLVVRWIFDVKLSCRELWPKNDINIGRCLLRISPALPASHVPNRKERARDASNFHFNANTATTTPHRRGIWMMAGSWAQIDPRLRGDEGDWDEEEEYDEEGIQPGEEGRLGYNPQIGSSNYDPQLDHDRRAKKEKLQQRFEHIFEKYGRDFEGIGDEIDLETGLIVVDNGHLTNMQHEGDPGYPEAAEFANPPADNLDPALEEDVDQNMTADSGSDADSEDALEDEDGQGSASGEAGNGVFSVGEQTEESATTPFETEDSAAEFGAKTRLRSRHQPTASNGKSLRGGPQTRSRKRPIEDVDVESEADLDLDANAKPADIYEQMQSLKASMLDLQSKHNQGQGVDHNDIEALGMSIARQLADFVGRDNKSSSKPKWNSAKDPMWSYPELPKGQHQQQQPVQRRLRSPTPLPLFTGPSPGQKSLWAPMQHPKPRKKYKRRKGNPDPEEDEQVENEPVPVPEDGQTLPDQPSGETPRKCTNCECTNSLIWRSGPDGDLCNACGMYYYRYGLIRPLEPLSETEESDMDEDSDIDSRERQAIEGAEGMETTDRLSTTNRRGRGLLRNARFTIEDDGLIIKLKEIDRLSWEKIAKHFPGRTAYGVQCRYSKKLNNRPVEARAYLVNQGYESRHDENGVIIFAPAPRPPQGWTDEEDDLLLKLREEEKLEWDKIADSFPGRTARAMERRFTHLARKLTQQKRHRQNKKSKQRKDQITRMFSKYTTHEDEQLIKLREVDKLSWADIALRLPGRNAMALQKRYVRELAYRNQELGEDPLVEDENGVLRRVRMKHSRFSREEDDMLLHARNDLGLDWKEIELKMPGRKWQSLESRFQYVTKGFSRHLRYKDAEATPGAAEDTQMESSANADCAQSEDELIQDTEDISSVDPCPPPSLQPSGQTSAEVVFSKDSAVNQDQSPNGHGFFIEGGMRFTPEEDTRIRQLRELEKLSWEAIAAKLPGRSVSAISARYYHTLFPRSESVNPLSKEASVTSFFGPKTLEIASRINLAASGIASKRTLRWTKEESEMVVHYYEQGLSFEEIGEQMPWRSHKAIKHFYTTNFPANKSKGKLVALTSKNDLLRRALGNTVRQSMPPPNTRAPLIDLTSDDPGDESPSRKVRNLELRTREGRPQLRKLLPRPVPGDEHGRLHRKYAADICTPPPRTYRARASNPLPHAHPPPEPASVEAYASLLSQYLADRDSPASRDNDAAPLTNPLTPSRSQQDFQRSSAPAFDRTAKTVNYSTPISHSHAHPYFIPPPANRHIPLFNTHGLSSNKAVIDPRLLEESFSAPPPVLDLGRAASQLPRSSLISRTPGLAEIAIENATARTPLEVEDIGVDDGSLFIDLSAPDPDQFLDDDPWHFNEISYPDAHLSAQEADQDAAVTAQIHDDFNSALAQDQIVGVQFDNNEFDVANDFEKQGLPAPETAATIDEEPAVEEAGVDELPGSDTMPGIHVDVLETANETEPVKGIYLRDTLPYSGLAYASEAIGNVADPVDVSELDGDESDLDEHPVQDAARGTPPPYSCEQLLLMAFSANNTKPMNVKDIYKFIEGQFPHYKDNSSAWRDAIQSCLDEKPEYVQVSSFRPLWVFRSALQQVASDAKLQSSDRVSNEQLEHEEVLQQPVRLITVKSLRERPPKVEQAGQTKRGPGRPRKFPKDGLGVQMEAHLQVEHEPKGQPGVIASEDRDELAPTPDKRVAKARSSSRARASSVFAGYEHIIPDVNKDPESSPNASTTQNTFADGADSFQEAMSELSNVSNALLSSSSPLVSMKTPGTVYTKADTPGTGQSTLFGRGRPQHRGVAALRSSFGPASARSRSSSVALPGSRKRVVYTPVRDVEGDEDELAG